MGPYPSLYMVVIRRLPQSAVPPAVQDLEARPQPRKKLWVVPDVLRPCTTFSYQWSLPSTKPDHNPQTVRSTTTLRTRSQTQWLGPLRPWSKISKSLLASYKRLHRGSLPEQFPLVYAYDGRSIPQRRAEGQKWSQRVEPCSRDVRQRRQRK